MLQEVHKLSLFSLGTVGISRGGKCNYWNSILKGPGSPRIDCTQASAKAVSPGQSRCLLFTTTQLTGWGQSHKDRMRQKQLPRAKFTALTQGTVSEKGSLKTRLEMLKVSIIIIINSILLPGENKDQSTWLWGSIYISRPRDGQETLRSSTAWALWT